MKWYSIRALKYNHSTKIKIENEVIGGKENKKKAVEKNEKVG